MAISHKMIRALIDFMDSSRPRQQHGLVFVFLIGSADKKKLAINVKEMRSTLVFPAYFSEKSSRAPKFG